MVHDSRSFRPRRDRARGAPWPLIHPPPLPWKALLLYLGRAGCRGRAPPRRSVAFSALVWTNLPGLLLPARRVIRWPTWACDNW